MGQPVPTIPPQQQSPSHDERWNLHALDWGVEFPRSPQHLSNQLRGKQISSQLTLFDDVFSGLPPEVQKQVREKAISVVGFDLTINQQRAYEAGLRLLAATGYAARRVVLTPDDWLTAFDVQKRQHARGWRQLGSKGRMEAFGALIALAGMPWLVSYKKLEGGKWYLIQRVATLWRVETKTPLGDGGRLDPEKTSPEQLSQIERIAIEFDDVWFDQRDQYYFYKPARLYTRLSLAVPGKIRRQPQHLHPFLDWIFSEAGRLRVEQKDRPSDERTWTLSAPWVELAHQCRMTRQLEHRNYKRVQATLKESAELARTAQIITGYAFDGETFSVTFDHRIFKDLDDYLEKQREKQQRRRRAEASDTTSSASPQLPGTRRRPALWRDPSQLSLNDINKLIDEHREAVKRIQGRITSVYDHAQGRNVPSRQFTSEEEDVLNGHRERIEFLTELKLGVRPLSPRSRGFANEAIGG